MPVIYLDVLLALNFAMDYCILRAASALGGRPCHMGRLALAAGFGALYAAGCVLLPTLSAVPIRLLGCAAMTAAAFGIHSTRTIVRQTLLTLLVAFVFGGCVIALENISGTTLTVRGTLYAPVSLKIIILAAGLSYGLTGMVFHGRAKENRPHGETVCISCGGTVTDLYLLVDTGNTLCDPVTGRPVLVLTREAAHKVLPENLRFVPLLLNSTNAAELVERAYGIVKPRLRLIAFDSVGGGGMMPCFAPDAVTRENGSAYVCIAAIASGSTVCAGEYEGLIEG